MDYNDYEILLERCIAPSIPDLLHRPVNDSDFQQFLKSLDSNLELMLFKAENQFENLEESAIVTLILIIGEQQRKGNWTTNSISIREGLLNIWNKILHNDSLLESRLIDCFNKIKTNLKRDTWKCHPSKIACATFISHLILERYFKPTKDYYDLLLPATLLQVDDFEIENRVNGLKILKQILAASQKEILSQCGLWNVMIDAIKRVLYVKDVKVLEYAIDCLGFLIKLQCNTDLEKWGPGNEAVDILLQGMNGEQVLELRSVYTNALPELLNCMKFKILIWLNRLLTIYIDYLDTSVTNNCLDEDTIHGISECIIVTLQYSRSFIFMYDYIIDKILLLLLRVDNCKIDQTKKEKSIQCLITAVSILLSLNKIKFKEVQDIYNNHVSKTCNNYKLQWTKIFEIVKAESDSEENVVSIYKKYVIIK